MCFGKVLAGTPGTEELERPEQRTCINMLLLITGPVIQQGRCPLVGPQVTPDGF